MFPDLDVRIGDVRNLEFETGSIGCYLSVGVVEHFIDGPGLALKEARRVLHRDGIALISVPYLNPARKSHLENLRGGCSSENRSFHQYYFSVEEFTVCLREAGLAVINTMPYAVEAFLVREQPLFSRFWRSSICRERVKIPLRRVFNNPPRWMRFNYGHMMMFACRPSLPAQCTQ
jgi:SAM-dependent methyltransferase